MKRDNHVRIIGGRFRSRVLHFPAVPGLRPTADRVRETLFNWIGQDLSGKVCLDLFAGSGAMGLEAASRGAARVVMVERERAAFAALQENTAKLGAPNVATVRQDALEFLVGDRERYDLIFLDPPFGSGLISRLLGLAAKRLKEEAKVYLECGSPPALPTGWSIWRQGRAGRVHYQLLERTHHDHESSLPRHL